MSHREVLRIDEPLRVRGSIHNTEVVVTDRFFEQGHPEAVVMEGDVRIGNVWIRTELEAPSPSGVRGKLCALGLYDARGTINSLRVDGIPLYGVNLHGCDGLSIRNFVGSRCWTQLHFQRGDYEHRGLSVRNAWMYNGWAAMESELAKRRGMKPSDLGPHRMGWAGFSGQRVIGGLFENVVVSGESAGMKLVEADGVMLRRCTLSSSTIQDCAGVWFDRCNFDRQASKTTIQAQTQSGVHVYRVRDEQLRGMPDATVTRSSFHGRALPGYAGEVTTGARSRFEGNHIDGYTSGRKTGAKTLSAAAFRTDAGIREPAGVIEHDGNRIGDGMGVFAERV